MNVLKVISILFCLAGIGTGIVALATTSWLTPGYGLIQTCITIGGFENCRITIGDDTTFLIVGLLLLAGLMLSFAAIIILFMVIVKGGQRKILIGGTMLFVAGLLIGAGTTTFTIQTLRSQTIITDLLQINFGYSFYLGWVCCGATLLSGLFAFIASCNMD